MNQCSKCSTTASKVWHSAKKYDRNAPKLCHACHQKLVTHERYKESDKKSSAEYYKRNKHLWYGPRFKDINVYAAHLYDVFVNRDEENKMSKESFLNTCQRDMRFNKLHIAWASSGFKSDLQPMVRKRIFSDPFTSTNIDWTIKRETDEHRDEKQEMFDVFVKSLVRQRRQYPEDDVLDKIDRTNGFVGGHQFSVAKIRKVYEDMIKAGLRNGMLVQEGDYIEEV